MADLGQPRAEKLVFSDKTLACSNDCAPRVIYHHSVLTALSETTLLMPGGSLCQQRAVGDCLEQDQGEGASKMLICSFNV